MELREYLEKGSNLFLRVFTSCSKFFTFINFGRVIMMERKKGDGREFRHSVEKLKKFWFELAAKIIRLLGRIMVCARINGE